MYFTILTYMSMGSSGMAEMSHMQAPLPPNTLPMQTGTGPFGPIEMDGDPGWYAHPRGTVAYLLDG